MYLEAFSLHFRIDAAPKVPITRRLRVEVGSGTEEDPGTCLVERGYAIE